MSQNNFICRLLHLVAQPPPTPERGHSYHRFGVVSGVRLRACPARVPLSEANSPGLALGVR